jgi:hypothetical protein
MLSNNHSLNSGFPHQLCREPAFLHVEHVGTPQYDLEIRIQDIAVQRTSRKALLA